MYQKNSHLKYYISAVVVGIMIVFGVIYLLRVNKMAGAAWWNDSWGYKKMITIDKDKIGIISDMNVNANSGQKNVTVKDGTLFTAGETVVIKDSSSRETNTVSSVAGNIVTMQNNLSNTYTTANSGFVKNVTDSVDLIDFPVLISFASDASLASNAKSDGYDIAFISANESTQLKHEIESYASSTGALIAWVKIPTLSTSVDTVIYMYYGNASALDQSDRANVWNSNYVTVHHLKNLTTSTVDDSTSGNYDGTKLATNIPAETTGKFYKGQDFPATSSINHGALSISNTYTAEAWIKADTLSASGDRTTWGSTVFASALLSSGYGTWLTIGKGGGTEVTLVSYETQNTGHNTTGAGLNTTDWFHIVVIATKSGNAKIYVNGVQRASFTTSNVAWSGDFTIGDLRASRLINFDGKIDEVRLSNNIRGFDWIATEYKNQNSPSTFYTLGSVETKPVVGGLTASSTIFMGGSTSTTLLSPILYYNFDEGYGTTAHNIVSTTGIGTLVSGTAWINDGKFGKALSFDGVDDYVDIPYYNFNRPGFTFSFWIKTSIANQKIFNTYSSTPRNQFYINSNGTIYYNIRGSNGSATPDLFATSLSSVNDNSWHHVVGVKDDDNILIYIDGKQERVVSGAANINSSSGRMTLGLGANGLYHDIYDGVYSGLIDEFKIYEYALTSDQVKLDYNDGKAMILGSSGTSSSTQSSSAEYCVPGDTSFCASPIAEYKFDEKTGTTLNDTSGNNKIGSINGATWVRGKIGSALSFDGSSNYVDIGNTDSVGFGNYLSISAWVKFDNVSDNTRVGNIIGNYNHSPHFNFEGYTSGRIRFYWNSGQVNLIGTRDLRGGWHHVTVVRDSVANKIVIYVDGVVEAQTTSGTNLDILLPLRIGGDYRSTAGLTFHGSIDDIKIYNYARTPAQVVWDYNRGMPIAHYKFDECSGAIAYDKSENENNGNIIIGAIGNQSAIGTCTDNDTTHSWYNGSFGKRYSAISLDGTDDYVFIADTTKTYSSCSAWIKTNSDSAQVIVAGVFNDYAIVMLSGNIVVSSIGGSTSLQTVNKFNDNNWHHIVVVATGLNYPNNYDFYVDGIKQQKTTSTSARAGGKLLIGARYFENAYSLFFNGLIDDVKIFSYALTSEQVKLEYSGSALKFN